MAYLTHSAYRGKSAPARALHAPRLAAVAIVLAVVAGSYAAMSYGGGWSTPASDVSSKGDRMVMVGAPVRSVTAGSPVNSGGVQTMTDNDGRVVFHQDQAQRTTTVVRGATIPLSEASPYPSAK